MRDALSVKITWESPSDAIPFLGRVGRASAVYRRPASNSSAQYQPARLHLLSSMLAFLVLAFAASALADGPPAYGPAPTYVEEKGEPHPYSYQYGVSDEYSGANFAANENSDTKVVTGSYTVHLPDGRIQTVTYTADHYNGYVADVKYEGTAVYPEAKPYKPAPAYAPAPAYKAAPAPPAYKPSL